MDAKDKRRHGYVLALVIELKLEDHQYIITHL